jgi:hypothetical protein
MRAVLFWTARVTLGLALATAAIPTNAQQMQGCEDHEQMILKLDTKFREQRAQVGVNQYGWLIELFESADGKTWTLVATRPGGPACVFGIGSDWQTLRRMEGVPS